jgi:hypothetical protein
MPHGYEQLDSIRRYHRHLVRQGWGIDVETAARIRYARYWRQHQTRRAA